MLTLRMLLVGLIALAVACGSEPPAARPTPAATVTPTETPEPTRTPTSSPPTATPTPGPPTATPSPALARATAIAADEGFRFWYESAGHPEEAYEAAVETVKQICEHLSEGGDLRDIFDRMIERVHPNLHEYVTDVVGFGLAAYCPEHSPAVTGTALPTSGTGGPVTPSDVFAAGPTDNITLRQCVAAGPAFLDVDFGDSDAVRALALRIVAANPAWDGPSIRRLLDTCIVLLDRATED